MKNKDHAVSLESYKDHSMYQNNGASTIIYHFWRKWSKLGHFGGQNNDISQNLGNCSNDFLPISF